MTWYDITTAQAYMSEGVPGFAPCIGSKVAGKKKQQNSLRSHKDGKGV